MQKFKIGILFMVFSWVACGLPVSYDAGNGDIVINEVSWAGSADSSNDELIELYNGTGVEVDLSGRKAGRGAYLCRKVELLGHVRIF